MLIVTINEIPGKKLEALGVVRGSTVQSRNLGHDMMAGFRTLVGGEVTDYAEMLTEARQIATGRMVKDAESLGADAIVGMRYASASVMQGAAEVIAYRNGGEVCMTAKEKQGFGLYFLFAFGMAWLCQVGGCIALLQQNNAVLYQLALIVTMFCPLLAVLLVQKAFLRQPTGIGWKVQGKRRFWLAAWFGPAVLTLLGAVLYFAVFPSRLDFSGSWLVAAYGGEMDAQTLRSQLGVSTLGYLLQNGLFAVLLAPAINMFPALGEEVGWRGYMMPRLKEQFGLLNGRLLGGVVWGIWHWPLMLLVGYEYGTDYLGAPLLGLVVWCVVCFALNTLLDILYEKTESIWVPAIAHGAFNAIAALPQVLVTPADAYYNVLGPMPIGLIAALPMLAAAVWLTLREMKQEEKN